MAGICYHKLAIISMKIWFYSKFCCISNDHLYEMEGFEAILI